MSFCAPILASSAIFFSIDGCNGFFNHQDRAKKLIHHLFYLPVNPNCQVYVDELKDIPSFLDDAVSLKEQNRFNCDNRNAKPHHCYLGFCLQGSYKFCY